MEAHVHFFYEMEKVFYFDLEASFNHYSVNKDAVLTPTFKEDILSNLLKTFDKAI